MSKDARFWDRMAKMYFKQTIKDDEAYRIKLAMTQEYLRPDMEVLEVGCGTGGTAIAHAPHVAHITATDLSNRMLGFAEGRKAEAGVENVTFKRASFEEALTGETTYDVVLALSLLHLLNDPADALRRLSKAVKPGGYLVSNTPCLHGSLGLMSPVLKLGGKAGLVPRVIQEFSEGELSAWLSEAGVKTVQHWRPDGGDAVFNISVRVPEEQEACREE